LGTTGAFSNPRQRFSDSEDLLDVFEIVQNWNGFRHADGRLMTLKPDLTSAAAFPSTNSIDLSGSIPYNVIECLISLMLVLELQELQVQPSEPSAESA
jgi:hypothetical protein